MTAGESYSNTDRFILPKDGPYDTFQGEEGVGFRLEYVCPERPGLVRYLQERGIAVWAELNTAENTINGGDAKGFHYQLDMQSPYVRAIADILRDELAEPPKLRRGSAEVARHALFNGIIEQTEWMSYVDYHLAKTDTEPAPSTDEHNQT